MTLAARCPSCATVFRVVQDQLRVSDGWVRCGRCAEVFNAIETLVEVETDLPPRGAAGGGAAVRRVLSDLEQVAVSGSPDSTAVDPVAALPDGQLGEPPAAERSTASPAVAPEAATSARREPVGLPDRSADSSQRPSFVQRAERAARWRRPGVRVALGASAAACGLALIVQAGVEYRDWAAAQWPALRPALEAACATIGCRVEPPRSIDTLAVDSSGLVRIEGSSLYRLSVVLRNRAALDVAVPALDLTLTDTRGDVIARRVVRTADFGAAVSRIPAQSSLALQTVLGGSERTISGYTIEIFYP